MEAFSTLDGVVVALYLAAIALAAWYGTHRHRETEQTAAGFFLAGRGIGWVVIGTALFATNIGSEHLVGLAGSGAKGGVAVAQFELLAAVLLLLLGWLFLPLYLKSGVFTMPEFLERRYSSGARWYLAIVSIISYVLTKISVTLAAGGIIIHTLTGWNFFWSSAAILLFTGTYTALGGLAAVAYSDFLQTVVFLAGSLAVTFIGLDKVGGWQGLYQAVEPGFFSLWKPSDHPDFPWTGILLGAPILGLWYWCTDQFIVQRVLSGKNLENARRGAIFGGYLKLLPLFLFVIPGVVAYALAKTGQIQLGSPDQALPTLVKTILPHGLRGLVAAGLLAALMSSLAGVFNSCSTLMTWDVYRRLRPDASQASLVWVGRVSTVLLVALAFLWIPFMKNVSGQLYQYLQSVQAYISPPIAAVFLLGILHRRVNATGAMLALLSGFVLGASRLVLELVKPNLDGLGIFGALLQWYAEVNFLHYAFFLFVLSVVVLILGSLLTPAPDMSRIGELMFRRPLPLGNPGWVQQDIMLSMLLLGLLAGIWLAFTG